MLLIMTKPSMRHLDINFSCNIYFDITGAQIGIARRMHKHNIHVMS